MLRHTGCWTLAITVLLLASVPRPVVADEKPYALSIGDTIEYYLTNNTAGTWTAHSVRVKFTSIDLVYDSLLNEYVTRPLFIYESINVWKPNAPPEIWTVAGVCINETARIYAMPVGILPLSFMLPLPMNFSLIYASIAAQLPGLEASGSFNHVLQYTYRINGEPQSLEFAFNQMGILAQYHFRNATLTLSYTMVSAVGDFPFIQVTSFGAFFVVVYLVLRKNRVKKRENQ